MSRNKPLAKKLRMAKANKQTRHWRRNDLKI